MQQAPEQLTPPSATKRPAEDNLASAKVKGINGGHGAVATKPQGLRNEGNDMQPNTSAA
jgi:hypothetical protein